MFSSPMVSLDQEDHAYRPCFLAKRQPQCPRKAKSRGQTLTLVRSPEHPGKEEESTEKHNLKARRYVDPEALHSGFGSSFFIWVW